MWMENTIATMDSITEQLLQNCWRLQFMFRKKTVNKTKIKIFFFTLSPLDFYLF